MGVGAPHIAVKGQVQSLRRCLGRLGANALLAVLNGCYSWEEADKILKREL